MEEQVEKKLLQLPPNLVKFITGNIRGLCPRCNQNKVPLIQDNEAKYQLSFIALSEAHLYKDISDAKIYINNFHVYCRHKHSKSHGGVVGYLS